MSTIICDFCREPSDTCVDDFEGLPECESCWDLRLREKRRADDASREAREEAWAAQDTRFERDGKYIAPALPIEAQLRPTGFLLKRQAGFARFRFVLCLLIVALAWALCGCSTDINEARALRAIEICKDRGGLADIGGDGDNFAYCSDGASLRLNGDWQHKDVE